MSLKLEEEKRRRKGQREFGRSSAQALEEFSYGARFHEASQINRRAAQLEGLHRSFAAATIRAFAPSAVHLQPTSLSLSSSLPPSAASPSSSRVPDADKTPRGAAFCRRRCRKEKEVDPFSVDSIEGHNRVSGKGFPTTGPRIEAGNVVTRPLVVACVPSGVRNCVRIGTDVGCSVRGSLLSGFWSWSLVVEGRTRLICASFGSTRLICASFESTRLICASLGITRLIGVSFGITRLICAFYGTTRLLCRVRVQQGADRQEAGRMREGHMDASGFLYASADVFC
ncbi:hypothetical protein E5676_scaffold1213G00010 [Cucumis melo var. makuwa]|uniref:Uncharacterized protein n=1 Tax=Cucumis melo var. makuwa TaxID=1194695 RepID=A0A5D3DVH5_CUCMM|nr:hypothetical protein E6C27_scaffold381G00010 [Cucumis melo var. makuwa]TYK27504.1 hypothetical protein E5676_scaffold1213G00010 [Cucumis melo var. makuwa]